MISGRLLEVPEYHMICYIMRGGSGRLTQVLFTKHVSSLVKGMWEMHSSITFLTPFYWDQLFCGSLPWQVLARGQLFSNPNWNLTPKGKWLWWLMSLQPPDWGQLPPLQLWLLTSLGCRRMAAPQLWSSQYSSWPLLLKLSQVSLYGQLCSSPAIR